MNNQEFWQPESIYYFKYGNNAGASLPRLMFEKHQALYGIFQTIICKSFGLRPYDQRRMELSDYLKYSRSMGNKSSLHQHLEYYLAAGEELAPKQKIKSLCPHCGHEQVRYITLVNQYSYGLKVDDDLMFCQNKDCAGKVNQVVHSKYKFGRPLAKRLLNFSTFDLSPGFGFQDSLKRLFKRVYDWPEIISDQFAFDFFKQTSPAS